MKTLFDDLRSVEEILTIATDASNLVDKESISGLSRRFGRVIDFSTPIVPIMKGRSRGVNTSNPLMYVVNYADNNGFAIISAHKCAPELLAVTKQGHFASDTDIDLEGFALWMEETSQMLEYLETENQRIRLLSNYTKEDVDTTVTHYIPSRVTVAWGQGITASHPDASEGKECRNGKSGCANTAIAMAMSFLERPQSIYLTYKKDSNNQSPELKLRWNYLKKYYSKLDEFYDPFPEDPEPDKDGNPYLITTAITQLFRELGEKTKSDYSDSTQTVTKYSDAFMVMHQLELTSSNGWEKGAGLECYNTMFYNSGGILLVAGRDEGKTVGHIWICDGLRTQTISKTTSVSYDGGKTWNVEKKTNTDEYNVSYNWGWHGLCDGYFLHTETKVVSPHDESDKLNFTKDRQYLRVQQ